jgi:nucleotide-binding universal stress UspA family protein
MYRKVLLAYDGSVEGRLALREGAKLAQLCGSDVVLLAVVEISASVALEGQFVTSIDEQQKYYEAILAEGVNRLTAMGFTPISTLRIGDPGQEIVKVAAEVGANLVVVGHRQHGRLSQWWFGSIGTYLVRHLRCSVLVAQTEISDTQFAKMTNAST